MVEFEQAAQEELYKRVAEFLRRGFGELAEPLDEPAFVVELGRTRLLVMVDAAGPQLSAVTVMNHVGDGIEVTPEVALYLLAKNHDLPFGSLCLREDGGISLMHMLFGEAVTYESLSMLLRMFAEYCVEVEDELTMQFR